MNDTQVTITGNVAAPPEHRRTPSGTAYTRLRVASTERRFEKSQGTWTDGATSWYTVSVWRALGEHAYASLRKGDRIVVAGRLRIREWESGDKSGTAAEVDAEAIGHDLLWGTTVFTRDGAPSGGAAAESARERSDAGGEARVGRAGDEPPVEAWATRTVPDSAPVEAEPVDTPF
ncbi:single-stranded DNA-binding protein [Microbacterium koreense]|uniref:Single-stranded DNA-binding protein n=1 Tax=Microbacterium koreense TaxID=323761 RepID=A0ABW2ZSH9_9MICO